ncbi:MAG TPA: hypothetical protein VK335_18755 [Bryobacteraceae bacterium]|nr:hypothetical protein [Bryobacteraceae bacterium]
MGNCRQNVQLRRTPKIIRQGAYPCFRTQVFKPLLYKILKRGLGVLRRFGRREFEYPSYIELAHQNY